MASGPEGITLGASADVVSLSHDHVILGGQSGDRILDAWIFAARHSAIDCVWVRGVKQVSGGRHCRRDEIRQSFGGAMRRLLAA
jgi:cytosine/adenosine deaminase-related metal-dependent hydrolase